MSLQASFTLQGHNPDVLTCIANLSNDEVFTPPEFVNQMLDTLEQAWAESNDSALIWADLTVTFLDPFTKSGVFLREITRRLTDGLESQIPDLEERVDHILTKQVFGIGITRLTSLLARRSVYCSKDATGAHSIAQSFERDWGNIWFERTEHTWAGRKKVRRANPLTGDEELVEQLGTGKCRFCGASEGEYARDEFLETHAYAFIHTDNIKARVNELFGADMQFDVIIGNPPYQLGDGGGGASASPIYQEFVEQAKALEPRMLTMIIPSRWFTGGKGLDDFRDVMLADRHLRHIDDYPISAEVFPQNGPKGGVCIFLRDREWSGNCRVVTHFKGGVSAETRPLARSGSSVLIRYHDGVSVLEKVARVEGADEDSLALPAQKRFIDKVSVRRPFGFSSSFQGHRDRRDDDVVLLRKGGQSAYVGRDEATNGLHLVDSWKVLVGFAAPGTGDKDTYPHRVISTPFVGGPGLVCTETYLAIGAFDSKREAESALSYLGCRFTRFLILLHKPSQNTTRQVYSFVPNQVWDRTWTDEALYEKYGITDAEIAFIESMVRPMEVGIV
ncbi:MAG: Eco57I restriction-modification methylase domain-containing protein [Microbacterium sp.]